MKRIIVVLLSFSLLLACVPTPEQEFVVNKGDGTFEELIAVTAAPQSVDVTEISPADKPVPTQNSESPAVSEVLPDTWEDLIETPNYRIRIQARIRTNGHPCPIRKVQRHTISADEIQTIASAMLPPINGVWNSTEFSKQEYEEALAALSAQGQVDAAKEVYAEMLDSSLPDEQFTPVSGVDSASGTRSRTYRCDGDQYASVSYYGSSLTIDAHRHAVAYSAETLLQDGRYPGEGPVHLSPSISREQAESILYEFLERTGFQGYFVCEAEAACYYGILNRTEYSQGWSFWLVRADEYVPIDMQRHGLGSAFRFERADQYSAPWHPESMTAYVSENSVESFGWYDPTETIEVFNPDVQLLPFDEMRIRIRNMLSAGLSWMADLKAPYGEMPTVSALVLTQALVPVKDELDAAYLMPTWVVVSDWYGLNGVYNYTDYCCFNAVDGSPISLSPNRD